MSLVGENKLLAGIILSAGQGKRIGDIPKALLKLNNKTFLEIIYKNFSNAGIEDIYIVMGYHADLIKSELKLKNEEIILNLNPEKGQLSSLQTGLRTISPEFRGAIITLVDLPKIKTSTYISIISAWHKNMDKIHLPIYNGRKGHPVIFPKYIFNEILMLPEGNQARTIIHKYSDNLITVNVDDPGIFSDVDTIEEYTNLTPQ